MNCDDARLLIHGHLDGELDVMHDIEVDRHIQQCPRCASEYALMRAMRLRLDEESLRFQAPARLKERIRGAAHASAHRSDALSAWRRAFSPRTIRIAIPLATAAILMLLILPRAIRPGRNETVAGEVVASHVRSMLASHLLDVASTDQHTVKPWFNGKLDYSPPVIDFAKDGFPLVGGRLDYIDGRPVAALVYQRHKHVINVFFWPRADGKTGASRTEQQHGYNVEQMTVAEMNCWIVSDLNQQELGEFGKLLRSHG